MTYFRMQPAIHGRYVVLVACLAALIAGWPAAAAPAPSEFDDMHGDGRVPAFYTQVPPLPTRPGLLLKKQPLEPVLSLEHSDHNYRILYSSTDGDGGKAIVAVSGAIFFPKGKPPPQGWPLIAWAHGTVGIADSCAPSVHGRSLRDVTYLQRWLAEGFAIVATDYQGLGVPGPHPYLNARAEAYSVLDSIRAAQNGFSQISHKVIVVGHSQGGQAAFATAMYAARYVPNLVIAGVVSTGTVNFASFNDFSRYFVNNPFKGDYDPAVYDALFLLQMAKQENPSLDLSTVLEPATTGLFHQAAAVCSPRLEFDIENSGLTRYTAFKPGALLRTLQPYARSFGYPTFKSAIPLFMGIGARDEEVPAAGQLALVRKACSAGTVVDAHLYANTSHSGSVNGSLVNSLPFVRHVLAGRPIAAHCNPKPQ